MEIKKKVERLFSLSDKCTGTSTGISFAENAESMATDLVTT
jgi:hypothetical protein